MLYFFRLKKIKKVSDDTLLVIPAKAGIQSRTTLGRDAILELAPHSMRGLHITNSAMSPSLTRRG